jgi:acyl-homoserine lactone acylase PvdQ
MYFLTKDILVDDMNVFFDPVLGQEPIYCIKFALLALRDPANPLLQEGRDALVLQALDQAASFLTTRFGSTTTGFLWKDFHETAFPSESIAALDGGAVPTDGGEGTVNVSSGSFFDGDNVAQHHVSDGGSIYRMVAFFDDAGRIHAKFNMPRGNSGEPSSKYWNNLTDDWANKKYSDMLFDDAEIDARTEERSTLEP